MKIVKRDYEKLDYEKKMGDIVKGFGEGESKLEETLDIFEKNMHGLIRIFGKLNKTCVVKSQSEDIKKINQRLNDCWQQWEFVSRILKKYHHLLVDGFEIVKDPMMKNDVEIRALKDVCKCVWLRVRLKDYDDGSLWWTDIHTEDGTYDTLTSEMVREDMHQKAEVAMISMMMGPLRTLQVGESWLKKHTS